MKQTLLSIIFTAALATGLAAAPRNAFIPGEIWPDNNSVHINAHGGGIPSVSSASIASSATLDASNNFVITFNRLEASITEATLTLEFSSDLTTLPGQVPIGATSTGPDVNGISVSINTIPSPDAVTVIIPAANAANGRIFTRLRATTPQVATYP